MPFMEFLTAIDRALATKRSAARLSEHPTPKCRLGRRAILVGAANTFAAVGCATLTERSVFLPSLRQKFEANRHEALPDKVRLAHLNTHPCATETRDWIVFRSRFVSSDGRVVDKGNQGVSHTESQGYGMLFAVAFDDRQTFDIIWNWTNSHLSRPTDALHAWRYVPGSANPVADHNNATDGDLYIAAALLRASMKWNEPAYLIAAQQITGDILRLLVREVGGRMVLLPAEQGFVFADEVVVNASYYAFPLIAELAQGYPSPIWERLLKDGHRMIEDARFGASQLPPDWLSVSKKNGAVSLASQRPPRFSFDAVRIPLFLAWDRETPQTLRRFSVFWGDNPVTAPAWIDLRTGGHAQYAACGGVIAIARLARRGAHSVNQEELPAISPVDNYYSAGLILLSRLALRETTFNVA